MSKTFATVLFEYEALDADELDIYASDTVQILSQTGDDEWWTAKTADGRTGLIPSNYVEIVQGKHDFEYSIPRYSATDATALPPGWERTVDAESGDEYYFNKGTGVTQWEIPTESYSNDNFKPVNKSESTKSMTKSDSGVKNIVADQRRRLAAEEDSGALRSHYPSNKSSAVSLASVKSGESLSSPAKQPNTKQIAPSSNKTKRRHEEKTHKTASSKTPPAISTANPVMGGSKSTSSLTSPPARASSSSAQRSEVMVNDQSDLAAIISDNVTRQLALQEQKILEQVRMMIAHSGGTIPPNESSMGSTKGSSSRRHKAKQATPGSVNKDKKLESSSLMLSMDNNEDYTPEKDSNEPFSLMYNTQEELNILARSSQKVLNADGNSSNVNVKQPSLDGLGISPVANVPDADYELDEQEPPRLKLPQIKSGKNLFTAEREREGYESPGENDSRNNSKFPQIKQAHPQIYASPSSESRKSKPKQISMPPSPFRRAGSNRKGFLNTPNGPASSSAANINPLDPIKYAQCRSVVYAPSTPLEEANHHAPPDASLQLEYVYGYQGGDGSAVPGNGKGRHSVIAGKNTFILLDGRIVYPAAALVVLADCVEDEETGQSKSIQGLFCGHSEDVTAIAVHPSALPPAPSYPLSPKRKNVHAQSGMLIASAQLSKDGRILIWNAQQIPKGEATPATFSSHVQELYVRNGVRGVSCLNFSGDGKLLVALGTDDAHTIVIFDWHAGTTLAITKASSGHGNSCDSVAIGFNPFLSVPMEFAAGKGSKQTPVSPREEGGFSTGCYTLISTGGRQVKFWTFQQSLERQVEGGNARGGEGIVMSSGFRGRQVATPKSKQVWGAKYVIEGNAGAFPKNTPHDVPDFTCFCCVKEMDSVLVNEKGHRITIPKSRVFTGTSNGSIYIWLQTEHPSVKSIVPVAGQMKSPPKRNKGGAAAPAAGLGGVGAVRWLAKGRLLSVVTDIHSCLIADIDYTFPMSDSDDDFDKVVTCGRDGFVHVWKVERTTNAEGKLVAMPLVPLNHMTSFQLIGSQIEDEEMDQDDCQCTYGLPRSVKWDISNSSVIVGTTFNSIYCLTGTPLTTAPQTNPEEEDSVDEGFLNLVPVIVGHNGKVFAIATHPYGKLFVTLSTDRTLKLWCGTSHRLLLTIGGSKEHFGGTKHRKIYFDRPSAVTFSKDGNMLFIGNVRGEMVVVGTGNGLDTASKTDAVWLDQWRDRANWRIVCRKKIHLKDHHTADDADGKKKPVGADKSEITVIKVAPSGTVVGIASKEGLIYLYDIVSKGPEDNVSERRNANGVITLKKLALCRGHLAAVKNMDFSVDLYSDVSGADPCYVLMSNDVAREILFWSVSTGKKINSQKLRDLTWESWSCTYGWPMQGVFNGVNGTAQEGDINTVARSNDGRYVVAGSSNTCHATEKLFRYPCLANAVPLVYGGHTSPVMGISFLSEDTGVVSVGGNDSCIFQYNMLYR